MSINNRTIKNNMERTKKGYLELILGPMYSGKTSTEVILSPCAILSITSRPSITLPKQVCLPSKC